MKTKFNPKVSIIIPVYNGENYLNQAINSALDQTYNNIEILVIDDGSTDKTEEIAKKYGDKIKYYKKENGGTSSALNYGITKMSGDYFSWLSHDDIYVDRKIEEQINILEKLKDKDSIVNCNVKVVDANLNVLSTKLVDSKLLEKNPMLFLALDTETGLNGCSLLISKACFEKVGKFDENCQCTQDYDMWFRLSKYYQFVHCPEFLVLSRRHDKQDSVTKTNICTFEADNLHSKMLNSFHDSKNLEEYFNEEYIINKYIIYKNSGYKKTAASILKIIIDYYQENNKINTLYSFAIKYLNLSIDTSLQQFSNIIKNNGNNIVYYNNVWISGGIENVLSNIFSAISKKYNITLMATKIDDQNGPVIPQNVNKVIIYSSGDIYSIAGISYCLRTNIFVGNPNIDDKFLDVYEILKIFNIKSVGYMHYNFFLPYKIDFLKPLVSNRIEKYRNIDVVVCLTDYFNQIYSVFNKNGITIPNMLNTDINKIERKNREHYYKLLSVGRFDDDVKRIDRLLNVFSIIYKKNNNVSLDIVGIEGNQTFYNRTGITIENYLKEKSIPSNKVVFHGECNNVQDFYKECDIYISTSESEGFGMTFLEAISFQMPVVMMRINGLDILVEDEQNGYIVEQDALNEMSEKILKLISNKDKYMEMSEKSYEMSKRFESDKIINQWIKLFDDMLKDEFNIEKFKTNNSFSEKYYSQAIVEYENIINDIITDKNGMVVAQNTIRSLEMQLNEKTYLYNKINRIYRFYLEHGKKALIKKIFSKIFRFTRKS